MRLFRNISRTLAGMLFCFTITCTYAQNDSCRHSSSFSSGLEISGGGNYSAESYFINGYRYPQRMFAQVGYEGGICYLANLNTHYLLSMGVNYAVFRYEDYPRWVMDFGGGGQTAYQKSFMNMPLYINRSFGTEHLKLRVALGLEPAIAFATRTVTFVGFSNTTYDYTPSFFLFGGAKFGVDIKLSKRIFLVIEEGFKTSSLYRALPTENSVFYKSANLRAGICIYPSGK
jgi:hypothetical protein